MEEFMNIMKLKVKSLELSPDKVNLISEKDCYIGAFLLGFIEYLQNIKVDSLVQFAEKLEKEIFNKKIIEELINAQIIPKNSVAISLESKSNRLKNEFGLSELLIKSFTNILFVKSLS